MEMSLSDNLVSRRLSVVHKALSSVPVLRPPSTLAAADATRLLPLGNECTPSALMDTGGWPKQAGIDLFWEQGYLVLPDFLAPEHVSRLNSAFESLVKRRRELHASGMDPLGQEEGWGNSDQFPAIDEQGPSRVFYLLHEPAPDGALVFLDLLDHPPSLAWVHALLNAEPHVHSTDGYLDIAHGDPAENTGWDGYGSGWHIDGILSGFRELGGPTPMNEKVVAPIPLMQLKLAYYLSDLSKPDQGNLTVIPKSHVATSEPPPESLVLDAPGAVQVCGPPGTCVLFHNAIFHTAGPMRQLDGRRSLLYYGYEHPCESSQNHSAFTTAKPSQCNVPISSCAMSCWFSWVWCCANRDDGVSGTIALPKEVALRAISRTQNSFPCICV